MSQKVAFVDDEPDVFESLKYYFDDEYFQIVTFQSPREALKKLDQDEFAVVVADQDMKEMEGTRFLQHVKIRQPNTICIIMTEYVDFNAIVKAMTQENIYQILSKPWDTSEVKRAVKGAVTYYGDKYRVSKKLHRQRRYEIHSSDN